MANIKHNKMKIAIGLMGAGAAYLATLPRKGQEGFPSADVVNAALKEARDNNCSEETLEAFEGWIEENYPESTGTPGAKGLQMGGFRNYKAAQADGAKTPSIRVPVEHLGVESGGFVNVQALTVADARAYLARLPNDGTVLVATAK